MKCATRDEELKQWSERKYEMTSWLVVQNEARQTTMLVVEALRSEPVALSDLGTETKRRSRALFGLLAATLKRRPVRILRPTGIEDRSGQEAWRHLLQEMEPLDRSRGLSLLEASASPEGWPWHYGEYMDQVCEYEAQVMEHERARTSTNTSSGGQGRRR